MGVHSVGGIARCSQLRSDVEALYVAEEGKRAELWMDNILQYTVMTIF